MTSCPVIFTETINVYYYALNRGDHFTQMDILLTHICILMYPLYSVLGHMESEKFFIKTYNEDRIGEWSMIYPSFKLSEILLNS